MSINNTTEELIQGIIRHGPDILDLCQSSADLTQYLKRLHDEHLDYPIPPKEVDHNYWFIPKEYKDMDIEEFLVSLCPEQNYDRLTRELELYRKLEMIPVLRTMKYIIDTLRASNIVWGVGRGSSVASYALFLMGVHRIDSVKYNLPIEEFFKEI